MSDSFTYEEKMKVLRNMAKKPVEDTFQGILRVSNYKELETGVADEYLNSVYYGESTEADLRSGTQETSSAYYGSIERFVKDEDNDPNYRTLKLPVTDSRGYFLNLFLGEYDATIGIKSEIGEVNASKYFPIIKSNKFHVGVLSTDIEEFAHSDSSELNIINEGNRKAKILIHSTHYHNNDALAARGGVKHQTVFVDTPGLEPREYDAFIYNQEYRDKTYDGNSSEKHAQVYIKNIKDYIQRRLDSYFDMNTKEVPAGMIIWHYSDLEKWYCPTSSSEPTDSDDTRTEHAGYRPSLYKKATGQQKTNEYQRDNTVQGVSVGLPHLQWENETLLEVVPEYKRDYVLCDGSTYTIEAAPSNIQQYGSINTVSFDRFYNLFHCIGYYYTPSGRGIRNIGHYKVQNSGSLTTSELVNEDDFDEHQLYEITMAVCNAFKALNYAVKTPEIRNNYIIDNTGNYNKTNALNWLKSQTFAKIPNCLYFESFKGTSAYTYGTTVAQVGTAVKAFTDTIRYYYYQNGDKKNKNLAIYDLPEVKKMIDLFATAENTWEQSFGNIFRYSFCVPKLFTSSDPTINISFGDAKNFGMFIGSTGLQGATEITNIKTGETVYPLEEPYTMTSSCIFNPNYYPHVHATTGGRHFEAYNARFAHTSADTQGLVNETDYISADYYATNYHGIITSDKNFHSGSEYAENYFLLQAETDSSENILYGKQILGIPSRELKYTKGGTTIFNWYGRTSEPINITTVASSNTDKEKWSTETFFKPENIRMLPLIKL